MKTNSNLTLATSGSTQESRRAASIALFEKIAGTKATADQLQEYTSRWEYPPGSIFKT